MMGDWGWAGMAAGWSWVFLLLLLAGIATLVILLVRLTVGGVDPGRRGPAPGEAQAQARAILDERYARGEIDTAEYDERLGRIRGDG